MINFQDFKKDGEVDWEAYRKAQVSSGERCESCGRFIVFGTGKSTACSLCKTINESSKIVKHDKFIRCPKCSSTFTAEDLSEFDIYEDGEHDIDCPNCKYFFVIETIITYNFSSPAIVDIDDDDDYDEDESYDEDEYKDDYRSIEDSV